jgi:hypothetical protein
MNRFRPQRTRFLLKALCVLVLLGATTLWILNQEAIIAGPWATVLSVLCTMLGVLFAFLQWHTPSSDPGASPPLVATSVQSSLFSLPHALGVNRRRGALVVKTRKKDIGATIHLCSGFTATPLMTNVAANITERPSESGSVFVALFPALEPGNYTVFVQAFPRSALVTIRAGQVAEVDWRGKGGSHGPTLP